MQLNYYISEEVKWIIDKELRMKTLLTTVALSAIFASSTYAQETSNVEQVTAALIKQQSQVVMQDVKNQVNQDIHFALRAMQMPKVPVNNTMIAKVEKSQSKTQDSE